MRLKKAEFDELGAVVYAVLPVDLYRAALFKEKNEVPFTVLSDAAGYAAALYGVSRQHLGWDQRSVNIPGLFVIDGKGRIAYAKIGWFDGGEIGGITAGGAVGDLVLEEVKKAAKSRAP